MTWTDLSSNFGSGTVLASSEMNAIQGNYESFAAQESGAPRLDIFRIGQYTGDGSTSQYISGLGMEASFLQISHLPTAVDSYIVYSQFILWKFNGSSNYSFYGSSLATYGISQNQIIDITTDGFTVDDNGADSHPNKNGETYSYWCWRKM